MSCGSGSRGAVLGSHNFKLSHYPWGEPPCLRRSNRLTVGRAPTPPIGQNKEAADDLRCSRALHAEAPSVTARRFYYDTVCYGSKPAFLCALEAFGADHLVTGSDYPVLQDWEVYRETFAYIERLGLPKSDTDKILHHNAQKLFGFAH